MYKIFIVSSVIHQVVIVCKYCLDILENWAIITEDVLFK